MDPLTHIVIGRAVVAAADADGTAHCASSQPLPFSAPLAPDIDSALAFFGWDRTSAPQFGTHSLLGALAMAVVTALIVDGASRGLQACSPRRGPP